MRILYNQTPTISSIILDFSGRLCYNSNCSKIRFRLIFRRYILWLRMVCLISMTLRESRSRMQPTLSASSTRTCRVRTPSPTKRSRPAKEPAVSVFSPSPAPCGAFSYFNTLRCQDFLPHFGHFIWRVRLTCIAKKTLQ